MAIQPPSTTEPSNQPTPRRAATSQQRPWRLAAALGLMVALILVGAFVAVSRSMRPATVAVTPTPTATPAPTPTPTLLYEANWSSGLASFHATAGWTVRNGALQSDTGANRALTLPYRPTATDYTIEFELQVVDVPKDNGSFFLTDRAVPGHDGFEAGAFHLLAPTPHMFADHPQFGAMIAPDADNVEAANLITTYGDYEHHFVPHVYRIDIRGAHLAFLTGPHVFNAASSSLKTALNNGPFTLTSDGAALRITYFRILTLPS